MARKTVTVRSRKYDLKVRRTWKCELVEEKGALILLAGEFDRDVEHAGLGSIRRGTISYEYYWLDRWYNVFRFHEPDGRFRNYYCNVAGKASFEEGIIDYVDLDLDVLVWPDGTYEVVDRDDFERNAIKFQYPEDLRQRCESSLLEIVGLITRGEFPFDLRHD